MPSGSAASASLVRAISSPGPSLRSTASTSGQVIRPNRSASRLAPSLSSATASSFASGVDPVRASLAAPGLVLATQNPPGWLRKEASRSTRLRRRPACASDPTGEGSSGSSSCAITSARRSSVMAAGPSSRRSSTRTESDRTRCSSRASRILATATVAEGEPGCPRSQVVACRPLTRSMLADSASTRPRRVSPAAASSRPPRLCAYQETECTQPDSTPAGLPAPSMTTRTPGAAAAKSSLSRSGRPGSLAISTRIHPPSGRRLVVPVDRGEQLRTHRLMGVGRVLGTDHHRERLVADLPPEAGDIGRQQMHHAQRPLRVNASDGEEGPVTVRPRQPPQIPDVVRTRRVVLLPGTDLLTRALVPQQPTGVVPVPLDHRILVVRLPHRRRHPGTADHQQPGPVEVDPAIERHMIGPHRQIEGPGQLFQPLSGAKVVQGDVRPVARRVRPQGSDHGDLTGAEESTLGCRPRVPDLMDTATAQARRLRDLRIRHPLRMQILNQPTPQPRQLGDLLLCLRQALSRSAQQLIRVLDLRDALQL